MGRTKPGFFWISEIEGRKNESSKVAFALSDFMAKKRL